MLTIIASAVILFALAFVVGRSFPSSTGWRYVDAVYYPLAAFGVVLLLASNSQEARDASLRKSIDSLYYEMSEKKVISTRIFLFPFIFGDDKDFNSIKEIVDIGNLCLESYKEHEVCPPITKVQPDLVRFLNEEELSGNDDACSRSFSLTRDLREHGVLPNSFANELQNAYRLAIDEREKALADPSQIRFTQLSEFRKNIINVQESESMPVGVWRINLFPQLRSKERVDYDKRVVEAKTNTSLSVGIFHGLLTCLDMSDESIAELAEQGKSAEFVEFSMTKDDADAVVRGASNLIPEIFSWLQSNIWQYAILLALSIKFAKGVSTVTSTKSRR